MRATPSLDVRATGVGASALTLTTATNSALATEEPSSSEPSAAPLASKAESWVSRRRGAAGLRPVSAPSECLEPPCCHDTVNPSLPLTASGVSEVRILCFLLSVFPFVSALDFLPFDFRNPKLLTSAELS